MKRPAVLDDIRVRRRYDRGQVAETIGLMPAQVQQAVRAARFSFSATAKKSHTLVVVGMGGSALGADVVKGVVGNSLKQQLLVARTPSLPAAVRAGCTVLAISYSGTTAETLAATKLARQRKVPIGIITVGGAVKKLAQQWKVPHLFIDESANPSRQPRLATASLTTGVLMALHGLGWRKFSPAEQQSVTRALTATWRRFQPDVPLNKNSLKQLAAALQNHSILTIASDQYWGNTHVLANQINENAKTFAAPFALPELNHHLLEGLRFPAARTFAGVFLRGVGDEDLSQRFALTKTVFQKNRVPAYELRGTGSTPMAHAFSFLVQTSLLSYYLALTNRVDPSLIPWVNFFKARLASR